MSDIFGGKSESYERQLESLHRDVLAALQQRALDLGAKAVVGLRLDFDEISGKNMKMLMVTATGLAVSLEVATSTAQPETAPVSVAGQDLEVAMFRAGVARGVEAGDNAPTLHHLAFATLYGVVELAAPVADRIAPLSTLAIIAASWLTYWSASATGSVRANRSCGSRPPERIL